MSATNACATRTRDERLQSDYLDNTGEGVGEGEERLSLRVVEEGLSELEGTPALRGRVGTKGFGESAVTAAYDRIVVDPVGRTDTRHEVGLLGMPDHISSDDLTDLHTLQ